MGYREIAEALLDEAESTTLDFKRQQYKLDGATDQEKAELIKDILAFANAFRRTEAYIFVGVEDQPGNRATIFGIADHIDDAKLQQLVSTKCNRSVEFRYIPLELEGKKVALIEIPLQQRPIYLLKPFGGLLKDAVYIRRGSSTATATPDEIGRMGQVAVRTALLSGFLVTGEHSEIIEKSIDANTVNLQIPPEDDIPHYGVEYLNGPFSSPLTSLGRFSPGKNENYYRELARWHQQDMRLTKVRLCVKNSGNALAVGVKLVVNINKLRPDLDVLVASDLLPEPRKSTFDLPNLAANLGRHDVQCHKTPKGWKVVVHLGKILAMDEALSSDMLYLGADSSIDVPMSAQIFADDLSKPVDEDLLLRLSVSEKTLPADAFMEPDEDSE